MKIGIFGSCVTRDVVQHLPPGTEVASYIARSSIVSAAHAVPYRVTEEIPASVGAFEGRMIRHDLEKTGFNHLAKSGSHVILIDLIDERFRVYQHAGTLVTLSARIAKEQFGTEILQNGKVVPRDEAFDIAFERGAQIMLERVSSSNAQVFVNEAYWAEKYASGETHVNYDNVDAIRRNNAQLRRYYDVFRGLLPKESFIQYHGDLLGDPGHVWGPAPFHFTRSYYQEIANKITSMSRAVATWIVMIAPSTLGLIA